MDYERARAREDSLDRLVELPAEHDVLGDVTRRSILDLGCGNGGKLAELTRGEVNGAAADTARVSRETEVSAVQTKQTAVTSPNSPPTCCN